MMYYYRININEGIDLAKISNNKECISFKIVYAMVVKI